MTTDDRLARQIDFLREVDRLKQVFRQTYLLDRSRKENDAEHSWHLAVMAMLLGEHAAGGDLNLFRAVQMVLVHDLVEIDAGDTFCYDEAGARTKPAREQAAADRIFALLPEDQACFVRGLWDEFEARQTPEAKYAAALDRLQPLLHNALTDGAAWQEHGVTADAVRARNAHMVAEGAPRLWALASERIDRAVARGHLAPGPDDG